MKVIVTDDYEELSQVGAAIMSEMVASSPGAAMVLATGDTPMGIYRELAVRRDRGELDASHIRVFQLDEYVGVPPDDDRSLYGWMARAFVEPLCIPDANVVRLPWNPLGLEAACLAYDQAVDAAGGYYLAVLGLGPNGHLGFNEPPCGPDAATRCVDLTEASIESNSRYWGGRERVPRKAVTAGMSRLLRACHVLLVVSGAHKRDILRRTISGQPTIDVPSSYLQQAPEVTVLADRAAWPEGHDLSRDAR